MIMALSGWRMDSGDADEAGFPLRNVGRVSREVESLLSANGVTVLVSSGACGADLIGLSEAGKIEIRRRVVCRLAGKVASSRSWIVLEIGAACTT